MKRLLGFALLTLCLCGLTGPALFGQDVTIERRDKKGDKTTTIKGKVESDTVSGIKLKIQPGNKEELIVSADIVRVIHGDIVLAPSQAIAKLAPAEAARNYPEVLKGLEAVMAMPEMKNISPTTKRYFDFRIASLRALTAEGDDKIKDAIAGLADFIAKNPECWQTPQAARQLGRLQADSGDYASATKTFESLEKNPAIPLEVKQEATAALIDIAFQSDRVDDAKKRVEALAKDPKAPTALKDKLSLYQLAIEGASASDVSSIVKKIEDVISKTTDPSLRGLAYNVIGDCYYAKGQRRDAMWSYLWVDVVYNQDRGEHLKAISRLIKVFTDDKDDEKVKAYKEKLNRTR